MRCGQTARSGGQRQRAKPGSIHRKKTESKARLYPQEEDREQSQALSTGRRQRAKPGSVHRKETESKARLYPQEGDAAACRMAEEPLLSVTVQSRRSGADSGKAESPGTAKGLKQIRASGVRLQGWGSTGSQLSASFTGLAPGVRVLYKFTVSNNNNNHNNVHLSCVHQRPSAHMIHINLNMIFYTHVEHSPTMQFT